MEQLSQLRSKVNTADAETVEKFGTVFDFSSDKAFNGLIVSALINIQMKDTFVNAKEG
jgi:hypothetical protein